MSAERHAQYNSSPYNSSKDVQAKENLNEMKNLSQKLLHAMPEEKTKYIAQMEVDLWTLKTLNAEHGNFINGLSYVDQNLQILAQHPHDRAIATKFQQSIEKITFKS